MASDWTLFGDYKTVLCAYVIENGSVKYICDTENLSDLATYTTYNSLIG